MAKNRIRPYGYKIEGGKTAIELREAEVIREIYRQYAAGLSYKAIAQALTSQGVRYIPDKPIWNKNMVARILQNESYLGAGKYPPIIEAADFYAAQQAMKPYTHTEPQDIKTLKPLLVCGICGEPVKRRLKTAGGERWYCPADANHIGTALTDEALLQSIKILQRQLAQNPRPARAQKKKTNQIDLATIRLQNEIDLALSQPESDPAAIQQSITALAARKYALCHDAEDGSPEIDQINQLGKAELDSGRLAEITAQIKVAHTQAVALVLKNGLCIKKGTV